MADRVLTWHLEGVLTETGVKESNTSVEFVADVNYKPVLVRVLLKTAPTSGTLTIDINDDGTSIFDTAPSLHGISSVMEWGGFASDPIIDEDSVITLDIDTIPVGAADLTVHLELDEL